MSYSDIGKKVFNQVKKTKSPLWGELILSELKNTITPEPNEIKELRELIISKEWNKAHNQFSKIRKLTLEHQKDDVLPYFLLAENIAKLTYNETKPIDLFDTNSGFKVYDLAIKTAKTSKSENTLTRVDGLLNLFSIEPCNFFAEFTKRSAQNLIHKIFENNDFEDLRNEFPDGCIPQEVELRNISSKIHQSHSDFPFCSFEIKYDIMIEEIKIGHYSILWDNQVSVIDDFLVIK